TPLHHGVVATDVALVYDSRDNEIVTGTGSFHELRLRLAPAFAGAHSFSFGDVNGTVRIYRSPWPWLNVAARLVGGLLLGQPPFYELTRVDDLSVFGGGKGIRGVVGQRYYGKVKLFGTLEGRAAVWHHSFFKKRFALAVAGFPDGGRVWTDLRGDPAL